MDEKRKPCLIWGVSSIEKHHPEGRVNSPETVSIPANLHAALTAMQLEWADALKAQSDDPVIQVARRIRVTMDYLEVTMDYLEYLLKACQRDSNFLVALSLAQQEHCGPDWWKRGGVAPLVSKDPDEN